VGLPPIDFLAVGHITVDVLPDGRRLPGGAATYGAVTAAALGFRAGIVTRGEPEAVAPAATLGGAGLALHVVPAAETTTFVNSYDAQHRRHQRVLALAPPLEPADLPTAWRQVGVAHFGAVVHEIAPELMDAVRAGFAGLGPQGWLRQLGRGEEVRHGPWQGADGLLARADAVILSEEDLAGEPRGEAWFAERSELLVVTAGSAGARAWRRGQRFDQPALPARTLDPTGAGDSFAAAFFIHMAHSGDLAASLRFAAAAAAFSVEHLGPGGIPGWEEVAARAGLG
jgi:sugar/nucleoside kinase (ribokinase family)